jgi:hypothetical protein
MSKDTTINTASTLPAPADERFVTADPDDYHAGWLQGYIVCSYAELAQVFGEPNGEGDGYKVSTSWVIRDNETGDLWEIYDYKRTSLYSPEYPTVEQFRALPAFNWHVGGTSQKGFNPRPLTKFLAAKLGRDVEGMSDR